MHQGVEETTTTGTVSATSTVKMWYYPKVKKKTRKKFIKKNEKGKLTKNNGKWPLWDLKENVENVKRNIENNQQTHKTKALSKNSGLTTSRHWSIR